MQKLIDLNKGEDLVSGLYPSLANNQQALWRDGSNIDFRGRRVRKSIGMNKQGETATSIYAIAQAFNEGTRRVYYARQDSIYKYENGETIRIGTGFTGVGFWSLETWGTFLLATDEDSVPQIWKNTGADSMVALPDFRRDTCRLIKKHKNHVLAYFGQSVDWSSDSNVELWEPATSNSAGGLFLRDLDSDIIAAQPLGENFGIYSSDKMTLQQYIGEPFFFSFRPAIEGIGAISDSSIIPVGNRNYGVSKKGFFVTDGIGFEYIDTPAIKDWFKTHFVEALGRRCVGLHDEERQTVKWWFECPDGICGVSYNYADQAWSKMDQEFTAAAPLEVFSSALVARGNEWGFFSGADLGDEAMDSNLRTFPLDAGQRENFKLWDLYRANFKGSGIEVRFGFQDAQIDPETGEELEPEWTDWEPLVFENWINRESVFLTVELRSSAMGVLWELNGFTIHGEVTAYV